MRALRSPAALLPPRATHTQATFTLLSLLEPTADRPFEVALCKKFAAAILQRLEPSLPIVASPVCTISTWASSLQAWQETDSTLIILPWGCPAENIHSGAVLLEAICTTLFCQPQQVLHTPLTFSGLLDRRGRCIQLTQRMQDYLALCPGWTMTTTHATVNKHRIVIIRAPYHTPARGRMELAYIHLHALYLQLFREESELGEQPSTETPIYVNLLADFLDAVLERLATTLV